MTTPAGEDRLLDEVEAALKATAYPGVEMGARAPDWLARLCARVRHLERHIELLEHERYGDALVRAQTAQAKAEAASQRLTEALRPFAKYGMLSDGKDGGKGAEVGDDLVVLQERAGPFTATLTVGDFRRAGKALTVEAPPEAGR